MASLFVDPSVLGGRRATIQVPAGRMTRTGTRVTADPRPGVLSLVEDSTGSIDLIWTSGSDTDRLTLFRGDATVDWVKKVTDGRVIVVDIKGRDPKFFWLQETTTERDEAVLKAIKLLLEKRTGASGAAAAAAGATTAATGAAASPSGRPATGPSGGSSSTPQGQTSRPADQAGRGTRAGGAGGSARDVSLQAALLSDALLNAIRADPEYYANRLRPFLPNETSTAATIVDDIRNPQASSAAAMLTSALQQPEGFLEIMASFRLPMDRTQPPSALHFLQSLMALAQQAGGGDAGGETGVSDD